MSNLYDILGIQTTASQADIRAAYKKLAFLYHPDVNPNNPVAEEKFKQINGAYQVLSDESLRSNYDFMRTQAVYQTYTQTAYANPQPPTQTGYYSPPNTKKPVTKKQRRILNIASVVVTIVLVFGLVHFGGFMNRFTGRMHYDNAIEHLSKGEMSKAYRELTDALEFYPDYLEAHLLNYKLSTDKNPVYLFAVSSIDQALKSYQDNADLYFKRGFAYLKIKRYQKAIVDFRKALEIKPNEGKYWFYLGVTMQEYVGRDYCELWEKAEKQGFELAGIFQKYYCVY